MPNANKIVWSHSLLDTYNICPRKANAERIARTAKQVTSSKTIEGLNSHKALEERVRDKKPLPSVLVRFEPFCKRLDGATGLVLCEHQMGVTRELTPTGFFSDDVWGRCVADLLIVNSEQRVAMLVDYKTGKPHTKLDQLETMAVFVFSHFPTVQEVLARYYWLNHSEVTSHLVMRTDEPKIWTRIIELVNSVDKAHAAQNFPAVPNFLCRNYCGDVSCLHNGRKT